MFLLYYFNNKSFRTIKNILKIPVFFLLIGIILPGIVFSQTTPCQITYKKSGGINRTRLVGLHEDLLLVASDTGAFKIVNIDKISHIKFDNGTYMLPGAGIGAAAGFVTGFVLYQIFGNKKDKKFIVKFLGKQEKNLLEESIPTV